VGLEAGCDTQGVEWWSCLFEMKGVLEGFIV
jgi:hypothetical protein